MRVTKKKKRQKLRMFLALQKKYENAQNHSLKQQNLLHFVQIISRNS